MTNFMGCLIYSLRVNKNLTRKELASKCELASTLIKHIEEGIRYPSDRALDKILIALETSREAIFMHENISNEYNTIKKCNEEALLNIRRGIQ